MKNKNLLVSVVIPTFKRDIVLCETIKHVLEQDYKNFELIVVDQLANHDEKTKLYIDKNKMYFTYIETELSGLPYARNIGIANSKGEIIIFIDDDVILKKDFIENHLKIYEQYPDISAIAGSELTFNNKIHDDVPLEGRMIFGRTKINYHSKDSGYVHGVKGCNMSFKKEIFNQVGLFDEKLPSPYLREDTDIAYRIIQSNLKIFYDKSTSLFHLQTPSGGTAEDKDSISKVKRREPWLNKNSYICETVFQIKHFGFISLFVYLPLKFVFWVILKNRANLVNSIKSAKAFFSGTIKGIKYYIENYK